MIDLYILKFLGHMGFCAAIFGLCRFLYLKCRHKKWDLWHEIFLVLFVSYAYGILSQTLFPIVHMGIDQNQNFYFDVIIPEGGGLNLVPFKTVWMYFRSVANGMPTHEVIERAMLNLAGNLGLFVPIGMLFPLAFPKHSRFSCVFFYTAVGVFLIEFTQYFCGRVSDIDDFLLNMLGVLLGYALYKCFCRTLEKYKKDKSQKDGDSF